MNFDDEISALMQRAVATVEPPSTRDTVRAGVERGRRLHRRRRLVVAGESLFGAAVVAGVAVLAVQFIGLPSNTSQPTPHVGAGGLAPAPVTSQTPAPAVVPPPVSLTPQVAAETLIGLLPGTGQLTHLVGATPYDGFVNGTYQYNDGAGASEILLGVGWHTGNPMNDQSPPCVASGDGCTVNPDGSQLSIAQGPEYPYSVHKGPQEWSATYLSADGLYVSLIERNSSSKAGSISRPEPPFTVAQLTAIVTSPQWSSTTSAATAAKDASLFDSSKPNTTR